MPNIPAVFSWMFLRLCVACRVIYAVGLFKKKRKDIEKRKKSPSFVYIEKIIDI
jgi:hypothetical protein